MIKIKSFIVLLAIGSCSGQSGKTDSTLTPISSENFNSLAREYFVKNIKSEDLAPLKPVTQCYLEETIKNDISRLEQSSLIELNPFILRNYKAELFNYNFSFIATKTGKFYMISLNTLYNFVYFVKDYSDDRDNVLFPRESSQAIKINSGQLNQFLVSEIDPLTISQVEKLKLINDIIDSSIRYFKFEVSRQEFDNLYAEQIVLPNVQQALSNLSSNQPDNIRYCNVHNIGCLIFAISVKDSHSKVDVLLIPPAKLNYNIASDVLPPYKYCAQDSL